EPDGLRIDLAVVDAVTMAIVPETPASVHGLDRASGDERWPAVDVDKTHLGGGVIADGLLYVVGPANGLSAVDTTNGEIAWSVPLDATARTIPPGVSGGLGLVAT